MVFFSNLLAFFFVFVIAVIRFQLKLIPPYPVLFFGPSAEIDEFAAIGAERSMGIVLPCTLTMTSGTLNPKGHSRSV